MDDSSPLVISNVPPGECIMEVSENSVVQAHRVSSNNADAFSPEGIFATETTRRRRNVMELDKSLCGTRLSHRHFLIQMQADCSKEMMSDPVRFFRGSKNAAESGRVVDWD